MRQILVELSKDKAGEAVIVEREDDFGFLDDAGMEICRIPALLRSGGHIVRWPQMPLPFYAATRSPALCQFPKQAAAACPYDSNPGDLAHTERSVSNWTGCR